tara:strand:- start:256 stop:474 length:219 start_codon:yes stop_codon:yes gene_type:complete
MNNQQQQQVPINIKDAEDIECDECKNLYFSPVVVIKRVSALLSPTGQEVMVPVQTFQCSSCSNVNEEFLQKQ